MIQLYALKAILSRAGVGTSRYAAQAVIEDPRQMSFLAPSNFLRWLARPLIPAAAVILMLSTATAVLGLQNWRERQTVKLSLEHGRQVIDTLDRLRTIISDLEDERHNFLLTLDPKFLKAY